MARDFAVRQCRLKWASLADGFWRRAACDSLSALGRLRTKIAVFSSTQKLELSLVGKPGGIHTDCLAFAHLRTVSDGVPILVAQSLERELTCWLH